MGDKRSSQAQTPKLEPENQQKIATESGEKGIGKHRPGCTCRFCEKIRTEIAGAAAKLAAGHKVRRRLKPRQKLFISAITNPVGPAFQNASAAARLAGYQPDSAESIGAKLLRDERVQTAMIRACERAGITDDWIAQRLREGMGATIVSRVKHRGAFTDERVDPDYHARAKHTELVLRLKGSFPRETEFEGGAVVIRVPAGQEARLALATRAGQKMSARAGAQAVDSIDDESESSG